MNSASWLLFIAVFFCGVMTAGPVNAQSDDLTGVITKDQILTHDRIYEIYIKRYEPNEEAVKYLSAYQDSLQLMVFLGNWCRESKKYLPGLMKTLELVDTDFITVNYIGVDAQKKIPQKLLIKFDIEYIPTVVVLKGNKELGRIEEKPLELIETDLIQILKEGDVRKE